MIACGIMLILAGMIMLTAALWLSLKKRSYKGRSAMVTGEIIHKTEVVNSVRHMRRYELTVAYTVDGSAYQKTVTSLKSEYDALTLGDRLPLLYRLSNPHKAVRADMFDAKSIRIVWSIAAGMAVIGALLYCIGYYAP